MRNKILIILFTWLGYLPVWGWEVSRTTVEFQDRPLAIELEGFSKQGNNQRLRFGWELSAVETNCRQVAYQLELGNTWLAGKMDAKSNQKQGVTSDDMKMIWNPGKIESPESQLVAYTGPELQASTTYRWRVRVWDQSGRVSAWSDWAYFRTAPALNGSQVRSRMDDRTAPTVSGSQVSDRTNGRTAPQVPSPRWIGAIRSDSARIPAGKRFFSREMRTPEYRAVWAGVDSLSRRSILLRKEFHLNRNIREAVVHVCGLGHYELTLNGRKVGNSEFAPLWTDYDKTLYYNSFDVSSTVRKGDNVFGVLLGNGFYNAQGGRYSKLKVSFGAPTLWLLAEFTYDDGSREVVVSDADWKYALSPVTFNDIYGGEDYDARLELNGWNVPVVLQDAPGGKLRPQQADPVMVMERFKPVSYRKLTLQECDSASRTTKRRIHPSAIVFDMGQNLSGFPEIKVRGNRGDTILLIVSEALTPEGACDQRQTGRPHFYRYILKGDGVETWHPRFSYYGFRYIQVEGAKLQSVSKLPELLELNSCFVYNSAPVISEFESSSTLFNQTHRLIEMAVKSNMQAVFTDCPHREKLGWLEQVHLNGPGLLYNFDLTRLFPKIMQDMADAQQPNGMIPTIAPLYNIFGSAKDGFDEFGDSPEWGSTFLLLPHLYEQFYGDSSLLEQYYPAMRRYVEYLISRSINHELRFGLGDWYDYGDFRAGYSRNTPVPFVATAYYFYGLKLMAQVAARLGNNFDSRYFEKLAEEVRRAFNIRWYNAAEKSYATGSQTALAMAIYLDIVDPENRSEVLSTLVEEIKSKGNRLTTGDIGNRYLFQTLAGNGLNELMYTMHHHEEAPGYGFQLKFGATTLTEQWDPRRGSSWNHFMMGQIDEWFFASLAGIQFGQTPAAKHRHFVIAPLPVGDLKFVKAATRTLYGRVAVEWRIEANRLKVKVKVPVNCTATVKLPGKKDELIGSGTHAFEADVIR